MAFRYKGVLNVFTNSKDLTEVSVLPFTFDSQHILTDVRIKEEATKVMPDYAYYVGIESVESKYTII